MLTRGLLVVVLVCSLPTAPSFARQAAAEAALAQAPSAPVPLEIGKPIEGELSGGRVHTYLVHLETGQYVGAVVDQKSIDLVVAVFGPDGSKLREVDRPDSYGGPETVRLVAEMTGPFRVEIRSAAPDAPSGRYVVRLDEIRGATEKDRLVLEADALRAKSFLLAGDGTTPEAAALAERAVPLYEKAFGSDHPEVATALSNLGQHYYLQRDYEKAESLYLRALAIREKAFEPDHPDIAEVLNKLGSVYVDQMLYAKAEPLKLRALAIREKAFGPDHPDVAQALSNLGFLYMQEGLYAKAEPLQQRALAIREKTFGPDHSDVVHTLRVLGSLYVYEGRYAEAEVTLARALAVNEKRLGTEHTDVADNLNSLGLLYTNQGLYARAEPMFLRALSIQEKVLGPQQYMVSATLNNLAMMYFRQDLYLKAEPLWVRALAIVEAAFGTEHPYVAIVSGNLGVLYQDQGLYAKAEPLLVRAVALSEKALGPDHTQVASAVNNLAVLYDLEGSFAKAEPLFLRALAIRERALGPDHPDVAGSFSNLAALLLAMARVGEALDAQVRANDTREREFSRNLLGGSERDKLQYLTISRGQLDRTLSLHIQSAPLVPKACRAALEVLLRRKGRALDAMTDQVSALRQRATPEDAKLLEALQDARSRLSALTLRGPGKEGVEQHRADLKALDEHVEALEAQISQRSAEFRSQSVPVTLDAVQKAIPADAALVEFASYRPFNPKVPEKQQYGAARYAAYMVFGKGEPRWVDLGAAEPIDAAVAQFRAALRDPSRDDVRQLARTLDAKLMQPVRALLGDAANLLISPDGPLNLIPFAALVDEHDRYLAERYTISYLTSGRDLLRLQERPPDRTHPLVVTNPDYQLVGAADGDSARSTTRAMDITKARFEALPATAVEGREIARLLPGALILTGARATESALKQAHGPRVLHVATHGFFFGEAEVSGAEGRGTAGPAHAIRNPLLRSGLALAGANRREGGGGEDGILTAFEAVGIDLWGTQLVVLSACDTGLGEVRSGDGVYGLRRALVLAGSRTQVMSLWAVDEDATRELMAAYYKQLRAGVGRAAAMQGVQLQMLRDSKRRHPAYWAGFIVSGDWRPLH
jgi:CHAT domain-containing protein/Tfp pilus assembly protein PilF